LLDLDRSTILLSRLPIIDRESGAKCNFRLRYNQYVLKERLKAHQKRIGGKIRGTSVKARRVGVSSAIDGFGVCHMAASPNARVKIVACLADTSKELFDVPTNLIRAWPFPLPEPLTTKIVYPHKTGDSHMIIMTAQTAIAGRGGRCTYLHLSEAAFFPVGGGSFTSLFPSVPDDPDTGIFVESTAYGKVGIGQAFWEFWEAAVRGDTEFCHIFLTWLDDPICFKEPGTLTFAEASEDEKDIISLIACKDKCGRCEKCYDTLGRITWRRWAIHNLCQGKVDKFRQEYPITAEEAFYASTAQAFEPEERRYARECINASPTPKYGRLTQLLDAYGNPVKNKAVFTPDDRSPLTIWRDPNPLYHYYLGVDCARGVESTDDYRIREGKDYAAVAGYCGQTGEQVCKYVSKIGSEALAALLFVLATFYNNALVAIELTGNLGLWTQSVLRSRYKYKNFYRWKGRDDRLGTVIISSSIGFEMNARTRPMILEAYRGGLYTKRIIPRDPLLLLQMEATEMVQGSWEVPRRIHDDALVSNMIAWIAKEQWHVNLPTSQGNKYLLGDEASLEKDETSLTDRDAVAKAKGDVEAAIAKHWKKMMRLIAASPKELPSSDNPDPNAHSKFDRLAGI
jgi:hypothetical protein